MTRPVSTCRPILRLAWIRRQQKYKNLLVAEFSGVVRNRSIVQERRLPGVASEEPEQYALCPAGQRICGSVDRFFGCVGCGPRLGGPTAVRLAGKREAFGPSRRLHGIDYEVANRNGCRMATDIHRYRAALERDLSPSRPTYPPRTAAKTVQFLIRRFKRTYDTSRVSLLLSHVRHGPGRIRAILIHTVRSPVDGGIMPKL
jgi:hypothetical protein